LNHRKIYDTIILKAKSENRKKHKGTYYEWHHINPKCLGGADVDKNKVLLTAREHYLCHKLLTYIYPKNDKIVDAFFRMTFSKVNGYVVSSRDYKLARELMNTTPKTEETKKKIKDNHAHYWQDKTPTDEHRKNVSDSLLGKEKSELHKQHMSEGRRGMKFSAEHCKNIGLARLGKKKINGKYETQS
jgi:hypothetical protein